MPPSGGYEADYDVSEPTEENVFKDDVWPFEEKAKRVEGPSFGITGPKKVTILVWK